jgi:hypothetical protein
MRSVKAVYSFAAANVPNPNDFQPARCHQICPGLELQKLHGLTMIQNFVFLRGCSVIQGHHPGIQAHSKEFISMAYSGRLAFMKVHARQSIVPLPKYSALYLQFCTL